MNEFRGLTINYIQGIINARYFLNIIVIRHFPGNHNKEETPVPIPNTEVKPFSADGTAWGTKWESRSLLGFFCIS